jgi:hypothetical protein
MKNSSQKSLRKILRTLPRKRKARKVENKEHINLKQKEKPEPVPTLMTKSEEVPTWRDISPSLLIIITERRKWKMRNITLIRRRSMKRIMKLIRVEELRRRAEEDPSLRTILS